MPPDIGAPHQESRIIFLTGYVEEPLIKAVMERIFVLAEQDVLKPINLIVNTYGGSVHEAFALYDTMKIVAPMPIHTIGLGKIMSAGCLLLAAGAKGHRYMGKNAVLMYHAGVEFSAGDVFQQEVNLAEFKRTERQYDELFAKETKKTLKQVEALYKPDRKDNYMTAQQCLNFGIVDKLI